MPGNRLIPSSFARLAFLLACLMALTGSAFGQAVIWSPHAAYRGRQVTLGPTGARGWVRDNVIYLVEVAAGSPADGLLKPHDAILGANGRKCAANADPRKLLGQAITQSETNERAGRLTLTVRRDDAEMDIDVTLRVMGSYRSTWPYECAKSATILHEACAYLAARQYPDGHFPAEVGMSTSWAGLLFLASGNVRYLDNARRAAYWQLAQSFPEMSLNCWPAGYTGLFLAEYYLATGDRTVLPKLQGLCDFMAAGQMSCGSWGHNAPWGGYGAVNQVGLVCYLAMILAEDCGLEVDRIAMKRSETFFHQYSEIGWIPYGDHRPWMGNSGNGKSALAAVVFKLLGGYPDDVRHFSRTVAASHAYREEGHTGSYFSFLWGPLAARQADGSDFRKFLDEQTWYYDLARTHEGGLVNQPNAENLGGRTPGSYTWNGAVYTTGGMALFYALPLKTLQILGAAQSPFDAGASEPVKSLVRLYQQRRWDEFDKQCAQLLANKGLSGSQQQQAGRLQTAAARHRESVTLTLEAIREAVDSEDACRGAEMLAALERLTGKDNPTLSEAQSLIESQASNVAYGKRYYELWSELVNCTGDYWLPYGKRAMKEVGTTGPLAQKRWETLSDISETEKQDWKVLRITGDDPNAGQTNWRQPGFDDSEWQTEQGPFTLKPPRNSEERNTTIYLRRTIDLDSPVDFTDLRLLCSGNRRQNADVYLNGVLVARLFDGPRRGYAKVTLRPEAADTLRKDANCLAVRCHNDNGQGLTIDLGLEGAKP